MLKETYPYYFANEPVAANENLAVTDKYTGVVATRVALADAATIDRAIVASVQAAEPMRRMPPYERQRARSRYFLATATGPICSPRTIA